MLPRIDLLFDCTCFALVAVEALIDQRPGTCDVARLRKSLPEVIVFNRPPYGLQFEQAHRTISKVLLWKQRCGHLVVAVMCRMA